MRWPNSLMDILNTLQRHRVGRSTIKLYDTNTHAENNVYSILATKSIFFSHKCHLMFHSNYFISFSSTITIFSNRGVSMFFVIFS